MFQRKRNKWTRRWTTMILKTTMKAKVMVIVLVMMPRCAKSIRGIYSTIRLTLLMKRVVARTMATISLLTWRSKSKNCGMTALHGARTRRATIKMIVIRMRVLRMKKTWRKRPYACRAFVRKSLLGSSLPNGRTRMLKMAMKVVLIKREWRHANPAMRMSLQKTTRMLQSLDQRRS